MATVAVHDLQDALADLPPELLQFLQGQGFEVLGMIYFGENIGHLQSFKGPWSPGMGSR